MLHHIKHRYIAPVSMGLWAIMHSVALAQAGVSGKCYLNGQEVPCEQALQSLKRFAGVGIGLLLFFLLVVVLGFVFWIMMLAHAISKPIENKSMWIVLLIFTGVLGAIAYYFLVKRKFGKQVPVAPSAPMSLPPNVQ